MPAAAQVVLGLAGDVARVAGVGLAGERVVHEEREVQRLAGRGTGRRPAVVASGSSSMSDS